MDKYGFIGFGSMGSMLVEGFLSNNGLKQDQVLVSTRTKSRLEDLTEKYPNVEIVEDNISLASQCKYVFVCVKPLEVKNVLEEISEHLREDAHIISIAASLTIGNIESIYPGKVTKVIPALPSVVGQGVTLICHNAKVVEEEKEQVEYLFKQIGTVKIIAEENFEAGADLTSCAPGMIAALFQEFIEAGIRHSSLSREEAERMVINTFYGTAKLLHESGMSFEETISRVATKGGITEEGVKIIRQGMPFVFDMVFDKTLTKHQKVKELINKELEQS